MIYRSVQDARGRLTLSLFSVRTVRQHCEGRAQRAPGLSICGGMSVRTVRCQLIDRSWGSQNRALKQSESSKMLALAGASERWRQQRSVLGSSPMSWMLLRMRSPEHKVIPLSGREPQRPDFRGECRR